MEGEGAYCYKCKVYRSNSWDKLHTHLRSRCLNTREKALLVNSYVHVQAKREFRLKAQAKRKTTMICVILGLVGWAWLVLFLRWGRREVGRPKKRPFFSSAWLQKVRLKLEPLCSHRKSVTRPIESWSWIGKRLSALDESRFLREGGGGAQKKDPFFRPPGCKKFVKNCNLCVRTEKG